MQDSETYWRDGQHVYIRETHQGIRIEIDARTEYMKKGIEIFVNGKRLTKTWVTGRINP